MSHERFPTLYQYEACPFCWKVRSMLSLRGIPFNTVEVHPLNKKELRFSPDYRKVPILVDKEGERVVESTDIMRHIDKQYGGRRVFSDDEQEQRWLRWADQTLVKALPPVIYRSFRTSLRSFDYIMRVSKFSWFQQRFIRVAGAAVMTMVAKKSAKRQHIQDPDKHFDECLNAWDHALETHAYLGGEHPNGADIAVFGILKSVEQLPAFEHVRAHPTTYAWYRRTADLTLVK